MNNDGKKKPLLISLADVQEKETEWLVTGYMPKGQINILAGDGGSGKTTIWCGVAAEISRGGRIFLKMYRTVLREMNRKGYYFSVLRIR